VVVGQLLLVHDTILGITSFRLLITVMASTIGFAAVV
jgi:hypothetical protein